MPVKVGEAISAPPAAETSAPMSVIAPVRLLKLVTPPGLAAIAALTKAVLANWVEFVPGAAVGPAGTPVKIGLARRAPPTPVTSAARRETAPDRPLKLETPAVEAATAAATKAVVASEIELAPGGRVTPCGLPVKAGLARRAPPTAEISLA